VTARHDDGRAVTSLGAERDADDAAIGTCLTTSQPRTPRSTGIAGTEPSKQAVTTFRRHAAAKRLGAERVDAEQRPGPTAPTPPVVTVLRSEGGSPTPHGGIDSSVIHATDLPLLAVLARVALAVAMREATAAGTTAKPPALETGAEAP
jgi:hypothetical protein